MTEEREELAALGERLQREHGTLWLHRLKGDPYAALLCDVDDDPAPLRERVRAAGPLWRSGTGVWVTADPRTAATLFAHPGIGHLTAPPEELPGLGEETVTPVRVQKGLGPLCARLLDAAGPEFDLVTEVAEPLAGLTRTLTAWVPLVDVPVERGCLIYVPGSHRRPLEHRQVHLAGFQDYRPMEEVWPDFPFSPRVSVPMRAGDVVFHDFRTVHLAAVNTGGERRLAFASVYMDSDATYRPGVQDHPVAHLEPGAPVDGELFPLIADGPGATR